MKTIERLLLENSEWAKEKLDQDPAFFERLSKNQTPEILWIGCSDSRVPAELIINAEPGEIFVHRNIANQVITTDFNSLSVVQFAVSVLKVKHIIVCGHYNCGGVYAALSRQRSELTLVNKWLMHIKDIYRLHQEEIRSLTTQDEQVNRLVELNIIEQVHRLTHTSIIQNSWKTTQGPEIHGWVYGLDNGTLNQLITLTYKHKLDAIYQFSES